MDKKGLTFSLVSIIILISQDLRNTNLLKSKGMGVGASVPAVSPERGVVR